MIYKLRGPLVSYCATLYAVTAWTILIISGSILAITATILATVFEAIALLKRRGIILNSAYANTKLTKAKKK